MRQASLSGLPRLALGFALLTLLIACAMPARLGPTRH
jgi:hypothetical protein